MQLTSDKRNFVVTNYLRTRSFKEVQQLFQKRLQDRVSLTEMTIWKKAKKYKTERLSFSINKDRSGRRSTERTLVNINLLQENPYRGSKNIGQKEWFGH